jgi:hypothetical protein
MNIKRFEKQKQLLKDEYQIISSQNPLHSIFKKKNIQYDVTINNDYPFKPPKIIKKTQSQQFQYKNSKQWGPTITLKKIFDSDTFFEKKYSNEQLVKKLLQGKKQDSLFQKLRYSSPFTSMSLLKSVSTYPNEGFDSIIPPQIKNNQTIKHCFKIKNVNIISFDHSQIIIGIYIPAFQILCSLFNITIDDGYKILLTDFDRLSYNYKLFAHMCFADLFKKFSFSKKIEIDLIKKTNEYIELLRQNGLLTIPGFDYENIHNNSLIFFTKH